MLINLEEVLNKLSSCELFKLADASFKGSLMRTLVDISQSVDKYTIESKHYDFMVKAMRSYKYPLSRLIVKAALEETIKPLLLVEPKDLKDRPIILTTTIPTFSTPGGIVGYVDLSSRARYTRDTMKNVESLKIKEVELYSLLQFAYVDANCKKNEAIIDKSGVIVKNTAIAYSRLFSKCIDRAYPISANSDVFSVSLFLSAVFCLKTFFGYSIEDAKNIVFSSRISDRASIEGDCKLLREGKLQFETLTEFLEVYAYEFSDYIREGTFNIRLVANLWQKMYGANSWFSIEHSTSFMNMILTVPIGFYNDKFISKAIKSQVDNIVDALLTVFSNSK